MIVFAVIEDSMDIPRFVFSYVLYVICLQFHTQYTTTTHANAHSDILEKCHLPVGHHV